LYAKKSLVFQVILHKNNKLHAIYWAIKPEQLKLTVSLMFSLKLSTVVHLANTISKYNYNKLTTILTSPFQVNLG